MFIIQSADLSHIFGCDLEPNQTGVIMKRKGQHYPQYSYDIIRKHSLMICSDIIEYNIVGDTKTSLLRCIPFISQIKNGDIIPTRQYMNYQSFTNLQIKKLLKKSCHSLKIELRDTTGEKIPFESVGITRVVLLFRKISDNQFEFLLHTKWLLKVQLIVLFFVDMQDSKRSQLQKKSEHIYMKLLLQRLEKLSVDAKNSKHLQIMLEQKQFENSWEVEKRNPSVKEEEPFLEKIVQKSVALAETFLTR